MRLGYDCVVRTKPFVAPDPDRDGVLMLSLRQTRRVYGGRGKSGKRTTAV